MAEKRILIWFRNDLRLHDHEPLHEVLQAEAEVVPFYCFDSRQFGQTSLGFSKTGAFRAQFLLEAIADFRESLRLLGSDLIIQQGLPEVVIPEL
uniref:deoxyribodipyrimidine photo-lyase n=1 Tax=Trichocoleus desertorum TaxID=1481672 RepID=UPI0025B56E68|nr:deoxyribodipyrimidine photo-lyase [Trichocoleus desertorum]